MVEVDDIFLFFVCFNLELLDLLNIIKKISMINKVRVIIMVNFKINFFFVCFIIFFLLIYYSKKIRKN